MITEVLNESLLKKIGEKSDEIYSLKLTLIEIKAILNLSKQGYRTVDDAIQKIDNEINK
jgi:hypothetical protein